MTSILAFVRRNAVLTGMLAVAAVIPSAYFAYLYYQKYRQATIEINGRDKLIELRGKLERLLLSLDQIQHEVAENEDEECIVCNSCKAVVQTYPCQHKVLCRMCFVKTLQVAVSDFNLPLKCVLCRTRITTLDKDRHKNITSAKA
ncbi:predicted protein [Nematostella vectensis]|uniref:RING-type domain-containing protein n=1 Tax=Nematostella vectensis TaxID=45351 RepID=A7S045_NEMVE|nr:uncharacterized protein LOC5514848 [Nematostella vectensis]EDO42952.1 predicted protein [Nematostella vectensis]|eukprot:XP_001635015.1 predicted protein [Nematostella vectensis]